MATIKLSIFDDFLYFLGFSCFHSRGSGAGAPDMGHVIHQNDHLVNPYHIQKKKLEKNIFVTLATPQKCQFGTIFRNFFDFLAPTPEVRGQEPPTWVM